MCCGGLRIWNTDQCIVADNKPELEMAVCTLSNVGQNVRVKQNGCLAIGPGKCLGGDLMKTPCTETLVDSFVPPEYELLSDGLKEKMEGINCAVEVCSCGRTCSIGRVSRSVAGCENAFAHSALCLAIFM